MDPAAENISYSCDIDIRELVSCQDVMEKKGLGPNGALVYCMEYIVSKFSWLEKRISAYGDNTYFLIDCPGQLELFSHYPVMKTLVAKLSKYGVNLMSVFCMDCTFISEFSKYVSGSCLALASMIQLELPHLNILTKCDLIGDSDTLDMIREIEIRDMLEKNETGSKTKGRFHCLNKALVELLENYSLIGLLPLNSKDDDSVEEVLYKCDSILQFYDNQEPTEEFYSKQEKAEETEDTNMEFN